MAADSDHRESRNKHRYLVFLVICFLMGSTASTNNIKLTSKRGSWWEGRAQCKEEYNSDLYIPESMYSSNLTQYSYYWVGALETSQWKWTDDSPLCSHVGYLTKNHRRASHLPGNSVLQCYRECHTKTYFGLSGTSCYCLDDSEEFYMVRRETTEYPCPGNFYENCGNANEMSVYKTDLLQRIDLRGDCAYAYKEKNYWRSNFYLQSGDCKRFRYAVCSTTSVQDSDWFCLSYGYEYSKCSYDMCTTCYEFSWPSASKRCDLVKLTNENKENFFKLLPRNTPHWIGLNRLSRKIWINGSEVDSTYRVDDKSNTKCLAVRYIGNSLLPEWRSCGRKLRSLCVNNKLTNEKSVTTKEVTSRRPPLTTGNIINSSFGSSKGFISKTGRNISSATENNDSSFGSSKGFISKTGRNISSATENNAVTTTDGQQKKEEMIDGTMKSYNNYGLYIYISTGGGVLVLAVLITAFVTKRREMFCFHKDQRRVVRFQAGTENLTYESDPQHRNLTPLYMSVQPAGQAANAPGDPNNLDIVSEPYNQVNKPQRKTTKVEVEHVNTETRNPDLDKGFDDQDVYNRAGADSKPGYVDNCYNHLHTDGENDYDIAGRQPEIDRWDSTYNHLDSVGFDKEESNGHEQEEDQHYYNVESIATRK